MEDMDPLSETWQVMHCDTPVRTPRATGPCVKTVFPLPNGNAIVILRPEAQADGSLVLLSDGHRFGDPGFYFTVHRAPKLRNRLHDPLFTPSIAVTSRLMETYYGNASKVRKPLRASLAHLRETQGKCMLQTT